MGKKRKRVKPKHLETGNCENINEIEEDKISAIYYFEIYQILKFSEAAGWTTTSIYKT